MKFFTFLEKELSLRIIMWTLMVICCLCTFEHRRPLAQNNFNVGHADTAAYALQGRSFALNNSFEINYISNFFHVYDKKIQRHDDHWPPFQGLLYGVAFKLFGIDASVARQAALFMGAVFFPLACAWLLFGLTGRHWPSLIVVLLYTSDLYFLKESFRLLADVSLCTLVLAYTASLLTSKQHHPAWLLLTGVMGGLAWTCKGSQIYLLPFLPLAAFILHGKSIFRKAWLYLSMLLFITIITPRLLDNWQDHGKLFHGTQNHVASYFGLTNSPWGNWDEKFYSVYWDSDLPKLWERFDSWPIYRDSLIGNTRVTLGSIILGPGKSTRNDRSIAEWKKMGWLSASLGENLIEEPVAKRIGSNGILDKDSDIEMITNPSSWPTGYRSLLQILGCLWAFTIFLLLPLAFLIKLIFKKNWTCPLLFKSSFVIALLMIAQASFVIILWYTMTRLILPIVPLSLILCLCLFVKLFEKIGIAIKRIWEKFTKDTNDNIFPYNTFQSHNIIRFQRYAYLLFWISIGFYLILNTASAQKSLIRQSNLKMWAAPKYPHYHRVAQTFPGKIADDAIIMTRNPWELLFYSPLTMKGVGLPHAEPKIILAVAKFYGVTHLIYDRHRAGLKSYLNSGHPGIKKIISHPSPIYSLDYSKFKDEEIAHIDELKGNAKKRK